MSEPVVLIKTQPLQTDLTATDNTPVIVENDEKQFYNDAICRLIRKLDRRLLPFLLVIEFSSFISRVSIGMYF